MTVKVTAEWVSDPTVSTDAHASIKVTVTNDTASEITEITLLPVKPIMPGYVPTDWDEAFTAVPAGGSAEATVVGHLTTGVDAAPGKPTMTVAYRSGGKSKTASTD
jgi:hypothetical protein